MDGVLRLNLINFLTFYYMLMFCAGTWRRWRQYRAVGELLVAGPKRWPRLLELVSEHRMMFLTWRIVAPALLALLLTVFQLYVSLSLFPEASKPPDGLTVARVLTPPVAYVAVPIIVLLGLAVFALDIYFLLTVGQIDSPMLEKYFDQAEYWLASPAAHVVKIVTFGYVNPRRMVATEVQKALADAGNLATSTFRWVSLQLGLRFSFGLSLWLTWAFDRIYA